MIGSWTNSFAEPAVCGGERERGDYYSIQCPAGLSPNDVFTTPTTVPYRTVPYCNILYWPHWHFFSLPVMAEAKWSETNIYVQFGLRCDSTVKHHRQISSRVELQICTGRAIAAISVRRPICPAPGSTSPPTSSLNAKGQQNNCTGIQIQCSAM